MHTIQLSSQLPNVVNRLKNSSVFNSSALSKVELEAVTKVFLRKDTSKNEPMLLWQ
jgi:hypothetical protein